MATNQELMRTATPFCSPHGFEGLILDNSFYLLDEHSEKTVSEQEKLDYFATVIKTNKAKTAFQQIDSLQPPPTPRATPPLFASQLSLSSSTALTPSSSTSSFGNNGAAPPLPPRKPGLAGRAALLKPGAFIAPPISPNTTQHPQLDAQLPFQTYRLPPSPDQQARPLQEFDYPYSERYFYEEGVAARKYWVEKYLDGGAGHSHYDRYNRSEVILPLRHTNMFHFNGDMISGINTETPSNVCTGFTIAQPSGHKLNGDQEKVSMIFASNWGSDVYTSYAVGHAIRFENSRSDVHYTIHGGNASLTGAEEEVHSSFLGGKQNCCYHSLLLPRQQQLTTKSKLMSIAFRKEQKEKPTKSQNIIQQDKIGRMCQAFPSGSFGRFVLAGTHDNLFGGLGYTRCLLQSNGIIPSEEHIEPIIPQSVSFFTLENKFWRVIALDSGYWAKLGHHHEDRLPQDLLRWLDTVVRLQDDTRGLIFLSHHNPSSRQGRHAFLLNAIHDIIGHTRTILWFAGDEQSAAIYQKSSAGSQVIHTNQSASGDPTINDEINSYIFVSGNGSLPLDSFMEKGDGHKALSVNHKDLVMYDGRVAYQRNYQGIQQQFGFKVGHPSFIRLDFEGDTLKVFFKTLQLSPTQSMANFGHEFNVESPVDIATYVFRSNTRTGSVEKISAAVFKHPHIITSLVPTDYRFIKQPIIDPKQPKSGKITTDITINTEEELHPLLPGLKNLFLDSHLDWFHPCLPLTISQQFYSYVKHIGDAVGDPEARDQAREAARIETLPKQESLLGSMRSSMRNLLADPSTPPKSKRPGSATERIAGKKNESESPESATASEVSLDSHFHSAPQQSQQTHSHHQSQPNLLRRGSYAHNPELSDPSPNFFTTPHPLYSEHHHHEHQRTPPQHPGHVQSGEPSGGAGEGPTVTAPLAPVAPIAPQPPVAPVAPQSPQTTSQTQAQVRQSSVQTRSPSLPELPSPDPLPTDSPSYS